MADHPGRRIIIGDVHGQYLGLLQLLAKLELTQQDHVYFLGDLVDRGPDSASVVELVRQEGYQCILGNHELMMIQAATHEDDAMVMTAWLSAGGDRTIDSYPSVQSMMDDVIWMQTLPTYLDLEDLWLVHAGVHPNIPLEDQCADEFCWIRRPFHYMETPFFRNKLIITGHTITFTFPDVEPGQLAQGPGWLDIETGAYHPRSGWLTALDFDHRLVYQVNTFAEESVRVRPLQDAVTPIPRRQSNPVLAFAQRSQDALNALLSF